MTGGHPQGKTSRSERVNMSVLLPSNAKAEDIHLLGDLGLFRASAATRTTIVAVVE
jgi:hypothetical protein